MLKGFNQDYWVAAILVAGLLALLAIVLRDYGVGLPEIPRTGTRPHPIMPPVSESEPDRLFPTEPMSGLRPEPGQPSPFYTAHFQPPRPKPPTTRKVNMTYLGLLELAGGERRAFLRVDNDTRIAPMGTAIVADLAVADMDRRTLTLTNSSSGTNILLFNVSKAVEVPIQ
jgi:hypothetical protein